MALTYNFIANQQATQITHTVVSRSAYTVLNYAISGTDFSGKINITPMAMDSASELDNHFDGEDKNQTKTLSLWISQKNFSEIKQDSTTTLSFRQGLVKNETVFKWKETQTFMCNVDGKLEEFKAIYLEDTMNKDFKLWIWDNATNPIIFRLDFGWQMILKDISLPKT